MATELGLYFAKSSTMKDRARDKDEEATGPDAGDNACVDRDVRTRITTAPSLRRSENLVRCPARERTVGLDDCRTCDRKNAIKITNQGGLVVRCQSDEDFTNTPGFNRISKHPVTSVRVGELLTQSALCTLETTPMSQVDQLWNEHGPQTVCVVDANGKLTGTLPAQLRGSPGLVKQHACPVVTLVPEEAPAIQAGAVLAYERVHEVPIVDADLRPVGMLTTFDALAWLGREAGYLVLRDE